MARTKTKPIGRTPAKRRASEAWLAQLLTGRALLARDILKSGSHLGWGWATIRRAKVNIGAQSFKKANEWWWFDPKTYTPTQEPQGVLGKTAAPPILEKIASSVSVLQEKEFLPQITPVDAPRDSAANPKPVAPHIPAMEKSIEKGTASSQPPTPPLSRAPQWPKPAEPSKPQNELTKPLEPPKARRIHIWDSALAEARESLISSAGFTDLFIMRAQILLRQEDLRSKGLLKEETALNDLVSRINAAVEKKKKQENLE